MELLPACSPSTSVLRPGQSPPRSGKCFPAQLLLFRQILFYAAGLSPGDTSLHQELSRVCAVARWRPKPAESGDLPQPVPTWAAEPLCLHRGALPQRAIPLSRRNLIEWRRDKILSRTTPMDIGLPFHKDRYADRAPRYLIFSPFARTRSS